MAIARNLSKAEGEVLKKVLSYDPSTGLFVWLIRRSRTVKGTVAGTPVHGYVSIVYDRRHYLAHRLAWFFVYGTLPENEIDHINGDKTDNRIANLRMATRAQNLANVPLSQLNTSGVKGVYWNRQKHMWQVQIRVNGRCIYLGRFKSKEDAASVHEQAEKKYRGEFKWKSVASCNTKQGD